MHCVQCVYITGGGQHEVGEHCDIAKYKGLLAFLVCMSAFVCAGIVMFDSPLDGDPWAGR